MVGVAIGLLLIIAVGRASGLVAVVPSAALLCILANSLTGLVEPLVWSHWGRDRLRQAATGSSSGCKRDSAGGRIPVGLVWRVDTETRATGKLTCQRLKAVWGFRVPKPHTGIPGVMAVFIARV